MSILLEYIDPLLQLPKLKISNIEKLSYHDTETAYVIIQYIIWYMYTNSWSEIIAVLEVKHHKLVMKV